MFLFFFFFLKLSFLLKIKLWFTFELTNALGRDTDKKMSITRIVFSKTIKSNSTHLRNLTAVCVCRRERSKVPYIVRQCIEEVEKRGIDEVGIYRISGVATDIQALKASFDTSKTLLAGFLYKYVLLLSSW